MELRCALQEAELEESLSQVVATMHGLDRKGQRWIESGTHANS